MFENSVDRNISLTSSPENKIFEHLMRKLLENIRYFYSSSNQLGTTKLNNFFINDTASALY